MARFQKATLFLFSAVEAQFRHHPYEDTSLRRSPRRYDNGPCETTKQRVPWRTFIDHLCRELRYTLGDGDFCKGRSSPCFSCTAVLPPNSSQYYEIQKCIPTGAASFFSCSDEADFCPGEWNFSGRGHSMCPVNAQISGNNLTGKGCCHQRVQMGQQV